MSKSWLYLSPHLDDVIYSCGGLICAQVKAGCEVEIWTIFAGDAQTTNVSLYARGLHKRWGTPNGSAAGRREEDLAACHKLGTRCRHFAWPDVIYRKFGRRWMVKQDADLFDHTAPWERELMREIVGEVSSALPAAARVVLPLGVGNHLDHRLVRQAGEALRTNPYYYADLPYAMQHPDEIMPLVSGMTVAVSQPLSRQCVDTWSSAMTLYRSQLDTFWQNEEAVTQALDRHLGTLPVATLWQRA